MAIVYSYPIATPEAQDLLVGTEMALQGGEDAPRTRTFTIGSIIGLLTPALDLKANITSPVFLGAPSLPTGTIGITQVAGNSTSALATTSFVTTADNLKANIASPTFTGVVTSPSFVKTGGLITQYLMANGSTSTVPTLSQVVTAGALSANPISITVSSAFTGASVYATSNIGIGIYGLSQAGIGVIASSGETIAGKFTTESSTSNIVEFYKLNVLKASIGNNGNITADSFIKSGGLSTQYLMADGDTTGPPTLQTVTTAGNTTNKTITANVAGGLTGVYGSSPTGRGIYGNTELGIGVYGNATNGIAVEGYTESATSIAIRGYGEEGLGGEFETDGVGNIVNFKTSGVLKASVGNGGNITAASFKTPTGTSSQYLMADGSVNANAVTDLTTVALTLAALNAAYPSVIIGFTVQCPDATVLKSYQKTASGWISYTIANVV